MHFGKRVVLTWVCWVQNLTLCTHAVCVWCRTWGCSEITRATFDLMTSIIRQEESQNTVQGSHWASLKPRPECPPDLGGDAALLAGSSWAWLSGPGLTQHRVSQRKAPWEMRWKIETQIPLTSKVSAFSETGILPSFSALTSLCSSSPTPKPD